MNSTRAFSILTGIAVLWSISACGQHEDEPEVAVEPPTDARIVADSAGPIALPPRTASPAGATVFFTTPADGDTVSNPVRIEFGLDGMNVVAAGVDDAHSGHHHLLVDTTPPDMALPIPADANHIHFGDASTSTELTLEPGVHTLRLLLGDHLHIPHDPPIMSDLITITIE